MKKKVIINADDFGYTPGVTQGIIEAHNNGVVTSTTALTVSEYFSQAMEMKRKIAPTLSVGVHLTLTLKYTKPLLPAAEVSSLIDSNGYFLDQTVFDRSIKLDQVYNEWETQILRFMECGLRPDHLDSHHNVHGKNADLLKVALELARKYHLPLRNAARSEEQTALLDLYGEVRKPDKMLHHFYGNGISKETLFTMFQEIQGSPEEIFEINCHPAFLDPLLQKKSSYCMERIQEFELLTMPAIKQAIDERGILLANYGILQ